MAGLGTTVAGVVEDEIAWLQLGLGYPAGDLILLEGIVREVHTLR
ncbi:MAG TPA: hypothetical protein VE152_14415 [Acidimicrobiales bacterium]|nr:hypothetical protein [Acidimicrobiales bacterium]